MNKWTDLIMPTVSILVVSIIFWAILGWEASALKMYIGLSIGYIGATINAITITKTRIKLGILKEGK